MAMASGPVVLKNLAQALDTDLKVSLTCDPGVDVGLMDLPRRCTLLSDIVFLVVCDLVRLAFLAAHSRNALAADYVFLRKQLALFQERKVKLCRMVRRSGPTKLCRNRLRNPCPPPCLPAGRAGFRLRASSSRRRDPPPAG